MCCCCVSLFLCCSCLVSFRFLSLPHSLWFSVCFSLFSLFSVCRRRLILNCERILVAIKYAAALLYIIPSISCQVSYSSIIHSRSGVTNVGLLYHTRSLAVRVLSLSSFLSLPHSLWFSLCFSLFSLFSVCTSHSELRTYSNKVPVCCCTAAYHTKYIIPSIIQQYHT